MAESSVERDVHFAAADEGELRKRQFHQSGLVNGGFDFGRFDDGLFHDAFPLSWLRCSDWQNLQSNVTCTSPPPTRASWASDSSTKADWSTVDSISVDSMMACSMMRFP